MEGRIYYHPSFPDQGERIMMEISCPAQATLPTQYPRFPAGQRAGAGLAEPSERAWRGKAMGDTASEARATCWSCSSAARSAARRGFRSQLCREREQAQETESKKWVYSASLHFGPGPHAKEALFRPVARLTNKSRVGGFVFLKWDIMGVSKHQH